MFSVSTSPYPKEASSSSTRNGTCAAALTSVSLVNHCNIGILGI